MGKGLRDTKLLGRHVFLVVQTCTNCGGGDGASRTPLACATLLSDSVGAGGPPCRFRTTRCNAAQPRACCVPLEQVHVWATRQRGCHAPRIEVWLERCDSTAFSRRELRYEVRFELRTTASSRQQDAWGDTARQVATCTTITQMPLFSRMRMDFHSSQMSTFCSTTSRQWIVDRQYRIFGFPERNSAHSLARVSSQDGCIRYISSFTHQLSGLSLEHCCCRAKPQSSCCP
jgi:hypothetical protein